MEVFFQNHHVSRSHRRAQLLLLSEAQPFREPLSRRRLLHRLPIGKVGVGGDDSIPFGIRNRLEVLGRSTVKPPSSNSSSKDVSCVCSRMNVGGNRSANVTACSPSIRLGIPSEAFQLVLELVEPARLELEHQPFTPVGSFPGATVPWHGSSRRRPSSSALPRPASSASRGQRLGAYSDDADHRLRQAGRAFRAMPITLV